MRTAGLRGARDHVGQKVFALGVIPSQPQQPLAQASCRRRHEAGIDLANLQLRWARIAVLDDRGDLAFGVAHDAPIAVCFIEIDRQHGERARVRGADQFREATRR